MQSPVIPGVKSSIVPGTILLYILISLPGLGFCQTGHIFRQVGRLIPKMSPLLANEIHQSGWKTSHSLEIVVADTMAFNNWCHNNHKTTSQAHQFIGHAFILQSDLTKSEILDLAFLPFVISMEMTRLPDVELKQEGMDYTLNEVTLARHIFPDVNGTGLTLSIKEELFDTADIDFKNRIVFTELSPPYIDLHATNMASIAAGGGNSDPTAKGVAWDVLITSSDFERLLPDDDNYFLDYQISVQNHAYGTGIENYYGIEAVAYDALCQRLPHLVHVFSAGNSGNQAPADGNYKDMTGWANLTGQFKQSKNTISVGATDSLHRIMSLSSRGPAFDGRIKPELVAYGHGGSSGAAAVVSGASVLLQDAYQLLHVGSLPPSSLIKALLINTAHDIGNKGPDFSYGFGSLRLTEAIDALTNQHFTINELLHNEQYATQIHVPAGTLGLKATVAWNDPPGEILSTKPLINDLDLVIINESTGEIFRPWVLNTDPHPDSLSALAKNGMDTINNVEQVSIDLPVEGNYLIQVFGTHIQTGSQEFAIAWKLTDDQNFEWTFPTASDYLVPHQHNLIRWRSSKESSSRIEYKPIGSANWITITDNVEASSGSLKWIPTFTGPVQLRWNDGIQLVESDTFLIATPLKPQVELVCADTFQLGWDNKEGADRFELFFLGERHLEQLTYTSDTIITLPVGEITHIAVAPVFDQWSGPVSYAIDYRTQGVGCYLNTFYLDYVLNDIATMVARFGSIDQIETVTLEEKQGNDFVPLYTYTPGTATELEFESPPLKNGINLFRLSIVLQNGTMILSDTVQVYYNGGFTIYVFPNPVKFSESIKVLLDNQLEGEVVIFDMTGKKYFSGKPEENPFTIEKGQFPPGFYILSLYSDTGKIYSGKFVVIN